MKNVENMCYLSPQLFFSGHDRFIFSIAGATPKSCSFWLLLSSQATPGFLAWNLLPGFQDSETVNHFLLLSVCIFFYFLFLNGSQESLESWWMEEDGKTPVCLYSQMSPQNETFILLMTLVGMIVCVLVLTKYHFILTVFITVLWKLSSIIIITQNRLGLRKTLSLFSSFIGKYPISTQIPQILYGIWC